MVEKMVTKTDAIVRQMFMALITCWSPLASQPKFTSPANSASGWRGARLGGVDHLGGIIVSTYVYRPLDVSHVSCDSQHEYES